MYKTILAGFLVFLLSFPQTIQSTERGGDKIIGKWISPEKDLIVQCFKVNQKYFGKIIWFKRYYDNSPDNPNALPENQWLNTLVMKDFVYENEEWNSGRIYQLKTAKTYDAFIVMNKDNELQVTGYVFFRFLSETVNFTRYTSDSLPI